MRDGDALASRFLLEAGATINPAEISLALESAVSDCNSDLVDVLLTHRASPDVRNVVTGQTLLHQAVQNGLVGIVELLLRHNAQVNAQDKQKLDALQFACRRGHAALVRLLIASKADLHRQNAQGESTLYIAVISLCQPEVIRALLDADWSLEISAKDRSPLRAATVNGLRSVTALLLERKLKQAEVHAAVLCV